MNKDLEHHNPYIAGKPLTSDNDFFGRGDIINKIRIAFEGKHNNVVVLYGQRRIGKTSILNKLERSLPTPPFFIVYFDLMDKARKPITEVLYDIALACATKAGINFNKKESFISNSDNFHKLFLPVLYKKLGPKQRLVLLFDEFDVLDQTEERLSDNAAAIAFHPYIRELISSHLNICFVFVVGRRMEELSVEFISTFKSALSIPVSVLEPQDAIALIKRGEEKGINFDKAAIDEILLLTRGHPYFLQLLCQEIFNRNLPDSNRILVITQQMVRDAVPAALRNGAGAFLWIWNGLPPAEKIIFSVIAESAKSGRILAENEIALILHQAGIKMLVRELNLAPSTLVEWNMLEKIGGGYRVYIELMRKWVEDNKQLEKVKEELEKISPLADMLYKTATTYFHNGNVESALQQLNEALDSNPNHFGARLLKGIILYERKEFELSIIELKQAFKLDEKESMCHLISAMLDYGQLLELKGKACEAEKIYEEIICDIYENEETARARKAGIVFERAKKLFLTGVTSEIVPLLDDVLSYQPENNNARELIGIIKRVIDNSLFAQRAYKSETLAESEKYVQAVLSDQPSNKEAFQLYEKIRIVREGIARANNAYGDGEIENALTAINQVLNIQPSNTEALQLSKNCKDIKDQISHARKAFKSGDSDSAQRIIDETLSIQSTNRKALELKKVINKLEATYFHAKQAYDEGKIDDAQKFITEILAIQMNNESAITLQNDIQRIRNKLERAKKAFDDGNHDGARRLVEKILEDHPLNKDANELLQAIINDQNRIQQNTRLYKNTFLTVIITIAIVLICLIVGSRSYPTITKWINQSTKTNHSPSSTISSIGQQLASFRFIFVPLTIAQQPDGSQAPEKNATDNLQLIAGYHVINRIPLSYDNEIYTQNSDVPSYPQIIKIPFQINNPLSIYLLMQADWGLVQYSGKQIGKINFSFNSGQTYDYPLVLGENIRDWSRSASSYAVTSITSPDIIGGWNGISPDNRAGGMDLLKIKIPEQYWQDTINSISVIDTSLETTGDYNPGIHILAISAEIMANTTGPWEYQIEQMPYNSNFITWDLDIGESLILSGGSLLYQGYTCSGISSQICIIVISATKKFSVTIEHLVTKNNWLAVSNTIIPTEAVSSVQAEFWLPPNCVSGCSYATVAIFNNDKLVDNYRINNPNQ